MKTSLISVLFFLYLFSLSAQPIHYGGCWLKDKDGSYFNPKGYVVIMEDSQGKFEYTLDDYKRMVRYGANMQVIRLGIGYLAGLDGEEERTSYLKRVDTRVQLAKKVGMKTGFKMTVYGMKDFNHQWGKIYDKEGEFRPYLFKAWEQIWEKYANEPSVIGYDLLNEPYRESKAISYEDATQKRLIPLYIDLIEKMKSYSPEKWAIYQPLLVDNDEKAFQPNKIPMMEIYMPAVYDRLAFAPHPYYFQDNCEIGVNRHLKEAQSANAALLFGEWGHPVTLKADTLLLEQHRFTQWYADIVSVFDRAGVGLIKPWFTGTRILLGENRITWSMFSDTSATGMVERKYLVDVICRPYPLTMAGCKVNEYGFDLARRSFTLTFTKNDFPTGTSEIYVPEDRHYPDGFTIDYNGKVLLVRDSKSPTGLKLIKTTEGFSKKSFRFDDRSQRLIISGWSLDDISNTIKITPGV